MSARHYDAGSTRHRLVRTMLSVAVFAVAVSAIVLFIGSDYSSAEPSDFGENLTWDFNDETKTLIIAVKDPNNPASMPDFDNIEDVPWKDIKGTMTNIALPASNLTKIGKNAFNQCTALNCTITLPITLVSIGNSAFEGCAGLRGELVFPSALTEIGGSAFKGCTGFTGSLEIPDGVNEIGDSAFQGCTGFDGTLFTGENVTKIWGNAFRDCTGFKKLQLGDNLKSIVDSGFQGCTGFEGELYLPPGMEEINPGAFKGCSGFTGTLKLPEFTDVLNVLGSEAFMGCSGFTFLEFGSNTVLPVENGVFSGCSGLTQVLNLPSDYYVGEHSFENCTSLISAGPIMSKVSNSAFSGCVSLTGTLYINGVIEDYAFHGCSSLTGVEITGSNSIGEYAFAGCTSLNSVSLRTVGSWIGNHAFDGCIGMTDALIIEDSHPIIGDGSFSGCNNVLTIVFPDTDEWDVNQNAFGSHEFYLSDGTTKVYPNDKDNFKGYTFAGSDCTMMIRQDGSPTAHRITYYDGIEKIASLQQGSLINGMQFTIKSYSKVGYDFDGWMIGTELHQPDEVITMGDTDIELKAVWSNRHHVTYDIYGGSGPVPVQADVKEGDVFTVLPNQSERVGYTFSGWRNYMNFATYQPGDQITMGVFDITLVAIWMPNHTVSYDLNGGSGNVPKSQTVGEGKSFTLASYQGTKEGYAFKGWLCFGEVCAPGSKAVMGSEDIVILAVWSPLHHVLYDLNKGEGEVPVQDDVPENSEFALLPCTAVREGYHFNGWTCNGILYQPGDILTMGYSDMTLKADWVLGNPTHHVTYDINGGEGVVPLQGDVEEGNTFIVKLFKGTMEGYSFKGWSYNDNTYNMGDNITMGTSDITLIAVWEEVTPSSSPAIGIEAMIVIVISIGAVAVALIIRWLQG